MTSGGKKSGPTTPAGLRVSIGTSLLGVEKIHIQEDYYIFPGKISDSIIYIDTIGTMKNFDLVKFNAVLESFRTRAGVTRPYVQIRDLSHVSGRLPFHLMKAQIASFLEHHDTLCGVVLLDVPTWLQIFINHCLRLYKTPFQVAIAGDLSEAVQAARRMLEKRTTGQALGRPLRFEDVIFRDEWVYVAKEARCTYRIGVIPGKLYFISITGAITDPEEIEHGGRLLERILTENHLLAIPYIVVDYSGLSDIRSLRLRQQWAREADRINRLTENTRAVQLAINPDRLNRIAISISRPFLRQKIVIVGSVAEAFEKINGLSGLPEELSRKRNLKVSAVDLEELSDALGMLLWHAGGDIPKARVSADNPLAYLTETIELIKSDLNDLMERERRTQEDRLRESEAHRLHLMDLMREAEIANEALRASEERYQLIDASSRDLISAYDPQGRLTHANRALCEILGLDRDAILGRTFEELGFPLSGHDPWRALQERVLERDATVSDVVSFPVGGVVRHFDVVLNPMHDASGVLIGVSGTMRDVTERKVMQEEQERLLSQLIQAQKMEAVGRLAGGVAHDFNNMLSVIKGNVELALEQLGPESPLREELEEVRRAAQNSTDLTRQLLAFARRQTVTPRVIDLNETVAGTLAMLRRLIGEEIRLSWEPGEDLWPVNIDPSQVDQVLANLCVNARDAIEGAGHVIIQTRREHFAAGEGELEAGDYVILRVIDDGCGMSTETLANLFEPFFTTKETAKGTGLGLSMIYGIARQNGGAVRVRSAPGAGSVFEVCLPRYTGEHAVAPAPAPPDRTSHARLGETVLVVEDEESILKLARRALTRQGYQVLTASTPLRALELVREHSGHIDLLITDVVMPEMNGRELAASIQASIPGIRRLFMSGYTREIIGHQGILEEGVHFLHKPFSSSELSAKVREALDSTVSFTSTPGGTHRP